MSEAQPYPCDCCGEPILPQHEWVALNRYLIGGRDARGVCFRGIREAREDDGYQWDMESAESEEWEWTGIVLHAACVSLFFEGELIDSRVKASRMP